MERTTTMKELKRIFKADNNAEITIRKIGCETPIEMDIEDLIYYIEDKRFEIDDFVIIEEN